MTKKLQLQECNNNNIPSSSSASSKQHLRTKDSHVISKFKPKIRIIHIYAPEIIKTDAANFRELVQRLTGKPEDDGRKVGKTKSINTAPTKKKKNLLEEEEGEQEFLNLQNETMVKNEHEEEKQEDYLLRRSSKLNEEKLSGFLDGFSELDGFIEELCTVPVVDQN